MYYHKINLRTVYLSCSYIQNSCKFKNSYILQTVYAILKIYNLRMQIHKREYLVMLPNVRFPN